MNPDLDKGVDALRPPLRDLPPPTPDMRAHSERVSAHIRDEIAAAGGWIPFSRYMELALYAPGLGYYSAGARKLGADGDFITAPELSPLFGQVLARQVAELFAPPAGLPRAMLEVGAGSGALAVSLLAALESLDALPDEYLILEVSADLRQRGRDTLAARVPHLLGRVAWLDRLPSSWSGVIIGNEVLDAMPVEVFRTADSNRADQAQPIEQAGVVAADHGSFAWSHRAAPPDLGDAVRALWQPSPPPGAYSSEVSPAAGAFIRSLGAMLEQGVALLIDYGFPRREYYHPQRSEGTLMCHYRHRAHADPFLLPGLQDITAHVDFTAIADAAVAAGMEVAGFATQAQFLINCGITDLLAQQLPPEGAPQSRYLAASNAAQRLLSPAEMGELFKVMALAKGEARDASLSGFARGDRTHSL